MDTIRFAKPRSTRTSPGNQEKKSCTQISMPSEFAFINNDHPDKTKDPNTRRRVRRHVMKDIGMSRRRGANEVKTAQIQHLLAPSFPIFAPFLGNLGELQSDSTLPNVYVALDLIDNAIVRFCGSNLAMNFLRQNPRPVHSMERMKSGALDIYMNSLSFVRQTLTQDEEMSEGMGNAMLGTVVCLAFYDMQNLNFHQWNIHMNGSIKIVQGQGGFQRLETQGSLHQALFWADLLGCLIIDVAPRTPLPQAFTSPHTMQCAKFTSRHRLYQAISQSFPSVLDLMVPLRSLSECAHMANTSYSATTEAYGWCSWATQFANVTHEVLTVPRMSDLQRYSPSSSDSDLQLELREAIRISTILFLLLIARNLALGDMFDSRFHRGRVPALIRRMEFMDWSGIEELRLWILVVAGIDELGEDRAYLTDQIREASAGMGLESWSDIVQSISEIAWVDGRMSAYSAMLEQEVYFDPLL